MEAARKSDMGLAWYKDIFFIYGPGLEVVQSKVAFWLYGESVAGMRKLRWWLGPLAFVAALTIAWIVIKNQWMILLLLLAGLSGAQFPIRMTLPLFAVASVLLALRASEWAHRMFWFWLGGVLTFLAFFYSMESGPMVVLSLCIPIFLFSKKGLLAYFTGIATLGLPFLLWAIFSERLSYVVENFFSMKTIMLSAQGKPTPILYDPIKDFVTNPLSFFHWRAGWVRWWFPPAFMGCVFTWVLSRYLQKDRSVRNFDGLILASSGLVFFFIALGRSDYDHWLKATGFYWLTLLYAMDCLCLRVTMKNRNWLHRIVPLMAGMFLSGIFVFYANPFNVASSFVTPARWPKPASEPMPESLQGVGEIDVEPMAKTTMSGLVERIWKYSERGDYVFIFSKEPIYYFLADVRNPTRYPHSIKLVTPDIIAAVIRDLEEKKPRLVLAEAGGDSISSEYYQQPLKDFILRTYEEKERFGGYVFLLLK